MSSVNSNFPAAVMARRSEPHDSLDFFPTPPWAVRALLTYCVNVRGRFVWEPACGEGHMSRSIAEFADHVFASDVRDYGWGHVVHDFLMPFVPGGRPADWVITNPPFRLAEQFIHRGLELAPNVAVLVRSVFTESAVRYEGLFKERPPAFIAQFVERVPMVKGRVDEDASSATAYCWMVWGPPRLSRETSFKWIPPCRGLLERSADYASHAADESLEGTLFEERGP